MKKIYKIPCILITAILILNLSSCQENTSKKGDTLSVEGKREIDFGGKEIAVVAYERDIPLNDDLSLKTKSLKLKNQVMLSRQEEAEKKFNCKIVWKDIMKENRWKQMESLLKTGAEIGQIVNLNPSVVNIPDLIQNNVIIPLDEYIDYESGTSGGVISKSSFWKGKHYGLVSDPVGSDIAFLRYNKVIVDREGQPDPYQLLQESQWSWDVLKDIVIKTTKDLNGDGVIDQWGLDSTSSYNRIFSGFIFSNGGCYVKEEDNKLICGLSDSEAFEALQFVASLYKDYLKYSPTDGGATMAKKQGSVFSGLVS